MDAPQLPPDVPPGPEDQSPLAKARRAYAREQAGKTHLNAAHAKIAQENADRRELHAQGFPCAPRLSGVRLKSASTGKLQDIMDDGSVRNLYSRAPGLSGRQFRKLRKRANKLYNQQRCAALAPKQA